MAGHVDSSSLGARGEETLEAVLAEAGWVRALARRLVRDEGAADDVAQGALLRAVERLPSVQDGLRPWLARVTRRLARRRVRTDLRRADREARRAEADGGATSVAPPELLSRLEAQSRVARAVASLPDPYRAVLLLRYFEGESTAEIARRTAVSPATVRSRLSRGLARLRDALEGEDLGDLHPRSEGRSTPAVLLLASGLDLTPIPATAPALLTMKLSTKSALVGVAALAGLLLVAGSGLLGGRDAAPDPSGDTDLVAAQVAPRTADDQGPAELEPERAPARVGLAETPADPAPPAPGLEPLPTVTTVVARVVGPGGAPVGGARFASVYATGRPRGEGNETVSGPDGGVRLDLADGDLRAFNTEVFPMVFRVEAEGLATAFEVTAPAWHGTTDLGDIALAPGGQLTGLVVDDAGAPVNGARVLAAVEGHREITDALRTTGPERSIPRPRTASGEGGRFTLAGLPAGDVQLWVHARGRLWTLTEAHPVAPGRALDVGAVTLELPEPEQRIEGVVLGPGGAALEGIRVRGESLPGGRDTVDVTGPDGRFSHLPATGSSVEFIAVDPSGRFGMSATAMASAGDAIELRLMPRRMLEIRVVDDGGEPVPEADVMAVLTEGRSIFADGGRPIPGFQWLHTDADGRVEMEVPAEPFQVSASGHGYDAVREGPFDHDSAPESVELVLHREKAIRGRVTFAGQSVPQAQVVVGEHIEGFVPRSAGFPERFFASRTGGVTTEGDGTFSVPVEPTWTEVSVVAFRQGLAAAEVALTLVPGEGAEDVVLEMVRGGGVAGVVLPPPGIDPETLYVAASRGDTRPIWTRPDGEGRYELTGMTPGPWRVEGRLEEPMDDVLSVANRPEDKEFNWNVEIVDGETAAFDVDMREDGPAELHGRTTIDGRPASGFRVVADVSRSSGTRSVPPEATIDGDGRFVLRMPAGPVGLRFEGELADGHRLVVSRSLTVRGPRTDWSLELVTGAVDERVDPALPRVRIMRASPGSEDWEQTDFGPPVDGRIRGRAPVGPSMIQRGHVFPAGGIGWENVRPVEPVR